MSEYSSGTSWNAVQTRVRRKTTWSMTGGRCFYCGMHVALEAEILPRDWLRVSGSERMVPEHVTPISRGGADNLANIVPSCAACNSLKGSFTLDEFRLARALRTRNMQFQFWALPAHPVRDWLICHSRQAERALFVHNAPQAENAYGRGRLARAKTLAQRKQARVGKK